MFLGQCLARRNRPKRRALDLSVPNNADSEARPPDIQPPRGGEQATDGVKWPICDHCKTLGFERLSETFAKGSVPAGELRRLSNIDLNCTVCQFFLSWFNRDKNAKGFSQNAHFLGDTTVRLVDAARTWTIQDGGLKYPVLSPAFRLEGLGRGPFGSDALILEGSCPDTRRVNFDCLRRWLEPCCSGKNNHWVCRRGQPPALRPQTLMVIDCTSKELIELSQPDLEYVTLSYVWGQGSVDLPPVLQKLPDDTPKVVSDSILVVLGLGFRYLWIDRYCIPQHDEVEKAWLVTQMGKVYAASAFTIVAVAGDGPDHGLPGVSTTERDELFSVQVGPCTLVQAKRPTQLVQDSTWATRGWTYQEGVLATRRFAFTPEQVYFQCQVSHALEISPLPYADKNYETRPFNLTDYQQSFSLDQKSAAFTNWGLFKSMGSLHRHFEDFFERDLTFDMDVLKAVAGFSHPYSLAGLPILNQESLRIIVELPNQIGDCSVKNLILAIALSWNIRNPVVRRDGFPTWTWAGWKSETASTESGTGNGLESQRCLRFQCLSFPSKYRTAHHHSFKELHSTAAFSLRFSDGVEMDWKTNMKEIMNKAWEERLDMCSLRLCAEGWTFETNLSFDNQTWQFPSPPLFVISHGQGGSVGSLAVDSTSVAVKCLVLHIRRADMDHSVLGLMFLVPRNDDEGTYARVGYGQFCTGTEIVKADHDTEVLLIKGIDIKREKVTVV